MPTKHDFAFYLDQLEVAEWKSRRVGGREAMMNCPAHGGSDTLSVKERAGKDALLFCFGPCGKDAFKLVNAALEDGGDKTPQEAEPDPTPVVVRRRSRAELAAALGDAPAVKVDDPMAWYADYCGVTVEDLENMNVSATADGWLAHGWDHVSVTKDRQAGGSARRWSPSGAVQPRMWPTVPDVMEDTVWLAEGESDVIVLRVAYGLPAYTAGSASQPPDEEELRALMARGVTHIVVAYDRDKAGKGARDELLAAAESVGLIAAVADMGDPLLGGYKDWRERWKDGVTDPPTYGADELPMLSIADIVEEEMTDLLLDRLHPTDHTVLFGDGGTGKGVIAAWWAVELAKLGHTVLVIDYERHKDEWSRRVRTFACAKKGWHDVKVEPHTDPHGVTQRILVYQPDGVIWDSLADIDRAVRETGATFIVIDSVTFAVAGSGAAVEASDTATRYFAACQKLNLPVLSIAHTTKADADPKHPFGSVFWHNGARVTVGVVNKGKDDEPRKVQVKKFNQGRRRGVTEIAWDWVNTHLPHGGLVEADATDVQDAAVLALLADGVPRSASQMAADLGISQQLVSNALQALKGPLQKVKMGPKVGRSQLWEITKIGMDHVQEEPTP